MISKCLKCGKKFTFTPVDGHIRHYCSVHCSHSHAHSGPKPYATWRKGIKCAACGKIFVPKLNHPVKYCSATCRKERKHRAMEPRDIDYINRRIKIDSKTGCWNWQRDLLSDGYGYFTIFVGGKSSQILAHRFTYELFHGKIEPGLIVRHKPRCNNPSCCNPDHLAVGTHQDNYWDSRSTHLRAARRRRGSISPNAIKVRIKGKTYSSITKAASELGIGWSKAKALGNI